MYFIINLKMKKPTLCCFTWIVFIELNSTVAFLLISKAWDGQIVGTRRCLIKGGMIFFVYVIFFFHFRIM